MARAGAVLVPLLTLSWVTVGAAVTVPGGGGKRNDCVAQLVAPGVGFPAGKTPKGATCADGDACDADGERDGACRFAVQLCTNVPSGRCTGATVRSIRLKAKKASSQTMGEVAGLEAAAGSLPTTGPQCTAEEPVTVPVRGPDDRGEFDRGVVKIKGKTKSSAGTDGDTWQLVCLPATAVVGATTTTTSTLPPVVPGPPRAGLKAQIVGASITAGTVVVTFTLTDDSGLPVTPVTSATEDADQARVRFTIARINVITSTVEGVTTTFYEYFNYITTRATSGPVSSDQPAYDSGGTLATVDPATGLYTYTFGKTLPADFPATLTHTIGAQVERAYEDEALVANPLHDFVPAGGSVTTVIQDTTTAECNACHDPLAAHGGGRREVGLCRLCHTSQAIDPQSGNTLDLKVMIHKIHAGRELPTVADGPLGSRYYWVGFQGSVITFAEKVKACRGGPLAGVVCDTDADCGTGGVCSMACAADSPSNAGATCTSDADCGGRVCASGSNQGNACAADGDCGPGGKCAATCTVGATKGVGFPQDIRSCTKCHTQGATATRYRTLPAAAACTSCHDDANPSDAPSPAGQSGTNHIPSISVGFPDANCRLCHEASGPEFDINVPGAHTVPERSTQLPGLNAEILSASGAPGGAVTITFRLTDGTGAAITDLSGFNRVAFALSGPTVPDFGSTTQPGPLLTPVAVGGGASGMLTGPDGSGVFTYVTAGAANLLPGDAVKTWRVGLEARRVETVGGPIGDTNVQEAPQNAWKDFSVDGSAVQPRRQVVDIGNCQRCHGAFSKGFSVHGNLRNQTGYCVVCHNPSVSDFARRRAVPNADPNDQPINLKHLVHKLHTGEELEHRPYVVYGFGPSAVDLSEVLYPGDRRDCVGCHAANTYLLPLPAGVHATLLTQVTGSPSTENAVGSIPPIQDACLSCHDGDAAQAHAETNTTAMGAEACAVCHGEGAEASVSAVHAREP